MTRRAASPASPHQRPEKLGTSSDEESVRLANQRRKASGAREFGAGVNPVACAQRIGNAVGPIAPAPRRPLENQRRRLHCRLSPTVEQAH